MMVKTTVIPVDRKDALCPFCGWSWGFMGFIWMILWIVVLVGVLHIVSSSSRRINRGKKPT